MPLIRMQFKVEFNFVCLRFLNEWEGADETVLILHASAHNPTGIDMTKDQWRQLKKVCVERGYLPFFDCAYQVSVSTHYCAPKSAEPSRGDKNRTKLRKVARRL